MRLSAARSCGLSLALVAIAALSGAGLRATTLVYLPFEQQVDDAGLIVVAVAATRTSSWDTGRTMIHTDIVFRVEETVKGQASGAVTVRQLGGVVGDVGQAVAGTPVFGIGKRYVLFLEPSGEGTYRVVGFSQGSYAVALDGKGKSTVQPQLAAPGGVRILGGGQTVQAANGQTLQEFLARVRARLDRVKK
jgi:hypothetical protein